MEDVKLEVKHRKITLLHLPTIQAIKVLNQSLEENERRSARHMLGSNGQRKGGRCSLVW